MQIKNTDLNSGAATANQALLADGTGGAAFTSLGTMAFEASGDYYLASNPSGYTTNTGTVTSVDVAGGTTGLTFTGGPITSSGSITIGGTLALANGGTGATTATGARANLGLGTMALEAASSYSLTSHIHTIANVTGLQTALDGKIAEVEGSSKITRIRSGLEFYPTFDGSIAAGGWARAIRFQAGSAATAISAFGTLGNGDSISYAYIGVGSGQDYSAVNNFKVYADKVTYNNNEIWHAGNLDPADYLPLSGGSLSGTLSVDGAFYAGDITASRGDTTGVIYLGNNAGLRYLYYDGTSYIMPGADLVVNGTAVVASLLDKAPLSHTHSYLPLSGGTLTGQLLVSTGSAVPLRVETSSPSAWAIEHTRSDLAGNTVSMFNNAGHWYFSGDSMSRNGNAIWDAQNFDPASKSDVGHTHSYLPLSGGTLTGTLNATTVYTGAVQQRVKLGVWDSNLYGIGMSSAYTFGGLGDYAMSFQMSGSTQRGWWWGQDTHTNAQGYMALNQQGDLTVATAIRVGYGINDTVNPSAYALDVNGDVTFKNNIDLNGGAISFGSSVHQMVNLWSTSYGIGVQLNTTYIRTDNAFSIHRGGTHSTTDNDPGAGGAQMLRVTSTVFTHEGLGVAKHVTAGQTSANMTTSTAAPSGGADGDIWYKV